MTERGFIAIARGALNHPVVGARKPYSYYEAWQWLMFEAAWKPRRVSVNNGRSTAVIALERGQLSHSRSYMAKAWGWTEKRVRTFLGRLEKDHQIVLQSGQPQMVITICNYERYQSLTTQGGRQTGQQTGRQWAGNGPEEEQGNKGTKYNERRRAVEPEGFAEWYALYPKKIARDAALRAYSKVVPAKMSAAALIERTKPFSDRWQKRPKSKLQYCPYPATWLNDGRYLDECDDGSGAADGEGTTIALPTRGPSDFTEAEWAERVIVYRQEGVWAESHWGPAPGQPGCLVPNQLLIAHMDSVERVSPSPARPERKIGAAQP